MRKVEYCIIGGGVAGLSAANRLVDLGKQPLVIEAGDYPKDRVCGEFLSSEILPTLSQWNIHPSRMIRTVKFFGPKNADFEFKLDSPSGSMSHVDLENHLLERAQAKKASILTNTRVLKIFPPSDQNASFEIQLSTEETILADQLLISVGKSFDQPHQRAIYYGRKAHFQGIEMNDVLEMYLFSGGYLGICPVDSSTINVAMISTSPEKLPSHLGHRFSEIQLRNQWLECQLPEFGYRQLHDWTNAYFIGEAAMSIPPITGDGLSMAISSGIMAAEYSVKHDAEGFRRQSRRCYRKRIFIGRVLHHLLMNQFAAKALFALCKKIPGMAKILYRWTRA